MSKKKTFIEINGKRYDAHTGEVIAHGPTVPAKPKPEIKKHPAKSPLKKTPSHHAHRNSNHAHAHHPEHAKTLMRGSVKKPAAKKTTKHHAANGLVRQPKHSLAIKRSVSKVDSHREHRAKQVNRSSAVSRFPRQPVSAHHHIKVHRVAKPIHRTPPVVQEPRTTAELLQIALDQAASQIQTPDVTPRRRLKVSRALSAKSLIVAAVILTGIVAYQNVTTVQVKMASSKAGFDASLPATKPAGYSLSHLQSKPGEVAFHFASNSDQERRYALTEKSSLWNSDALLDNFVASAGSDYRTVEAGGRTVYIYGQQNATWVNAGVWYDVKSGGALSDRQLIDIATSI